MQNGNRPTIQQFDAECFEIYPYFVEYFGNLQMTKVQDIQISNKIFSLYVANIKYMIQTGNYHRYVVTYNNKDTRPVGYSVPLSSLSWICLQTRELDTVYKIPVQTYIPRRIRCLDHTIRRISSGDIFDYECPNIPSIKITVLQTEKKEAYTNENNLINAIEEYKTIITWR